MKQCPKCNRTYPEEDILNYCLNDGSILSPVHDPDATLRDSALDNRTLMPTEDLGGNTPSLGVINNNSQKFYLAIILTAIVVGIVMWILLRPGTSSPSARNSSDITNKSSAREMLAPANLARGKPVYITTNGADDGSEAGNEACNNPSEVTDGSLDEAADCPYNGTVGWQNKDYRELMIVNVTIDLQRTCNIDKIRYNMGNVNRAEDWSADMMITPFGLTKIKRGLKDIGIWTEQTGALVASSVTITLQKTRTSEYTNWLYIGEIEIIGTCVDNAR